MMVRLSPVPRQQWSVGMRKAVSLLLPPRSHRPPNDGRPTAAGVLEAFAHHPDLAQAYFTYNRHVLWGTTLPPRWRHILIMRVAARRHASLLHRQHAPQARDAGLTDAEIELLAELPEAPLPDPLEAALSRAVDEWVDDGCVADETWALLREKLDPSPQQLLDVLFTIGCYVTIAAFMRSVGLTADAEAALEVGR